MASTRESSPALGSSSSSPAALSPNSKLKVMLAQLDDDSEDEVVNRVTAKDRLLAAMRKSEPQKEETAETTPISAADIEAPRHNEVSDDDDEEILRPKGRMAARMQALVESDEAGAVDTEDEAGASQNTAEENAEAPTNSDDSDAPVISRKRKIRVPRKQTPRSSPAKSTGSPSSPGLFVSPAKDGSPARDTDNSDSDELPDVSDMNSTKNARFQALVAKKRAERQAEEAEREKERLRKVAERKKQAEFFENDRNLDDSDEEAGKRLTQQTRAPRKASKRALEDMNRETQRMSRNQQLAYNPTVKKKVNKSSLFAKFKFKAKNHTDEMSSDPTRPTSSSSAAPHSDQEMKGTPPSSPPSHASDVEKSAPANQVTLEFAGEQLDEAMPTLDELVKLQSSPPARLDKGKGKAIETEESLLASEMAPEVSKKPKFAQRLIRVRPPKPEDREVSVMDDSDSDIEIVTKKTPLRKRLDAVFDRVPAKQAQESRSMHVLRALAHLKSPNKSNMGRNKNAKPGISNSELEISLQQRARQQAKRDREKRLEALKAKGIIIQTAEERETEAAEFEDLLSKARQDVAELAKKEKKERKNGSEDDLMDDSSDDEDWEEEKAEPVEEAALSGSDDEEDLDGESSEEDEDAMAIDDDAQKASAGNPLFDDEAGDTDDDEEIEMLRDGEMAEDGDVDDDDEELPVVHAARKPRKLNIISDDEDESEVEKVTPTLTQTDSPQPNTDSPIAPKSVLRSATKTFIPGVTVAGPAGLGLTQIFAGTMDESQMSPTDMELQSQEVEAKNDPLDFLRRQPAPTLPPFIPTMAEDTQEFDVVNQSQVSHVPESQGETQTQGIRLHFEQSQVHGFDSFVTDSQFSQIPDATQDVGFTHQTPIKNRFAGMPSTIETVVLEPGALPESLDETPIVKKKGKLRRRMQVASFSDEEDNLEPAPAAVEEEETYLEASVFDVMRKASKKKLVVDEFDKKKSAAKSMVNEQAEESEDEYAGLGGNSDDESGGEADEYTKEMIDDEGKEKVNERELAAMFADRERADAEKDINKIYNDITKGMLRRKRGADYELSDSDDGGEARQKRKRREFAKMRKAMLKDESLGKLASNPKHEQFLRTIEDRGDEKEMDFLEDYAEEEPSMDSQSQSQSQAEVIPNSQPTDMAPPPKRKLDTATEAENRLPPHLRRTRAPKKPSTLLETRSSISSLLDDPHQMLVAPESDSGSEDELEIVDEDDLGSGSQGKNKENRDPFALRRSHAGVVDRISLKRQSSSTVSTSTRLAFVSSSSTPGFKVPPLLRRATTNNSIVSTTSNSSVVSRTERTAGGEEKGGMKRGGVKGSGVNYFARESERRAAVVKTEKKREQKLVKGAQVRRKVVGGMFGGGKFE